MPNLKNKTKFNGSSIPKNVGWLEKYGDGGETDPPIGLKNNQWMGANLNKEGYITSETKGGNRITFTGNQKADELFNKQIDSGKFGFDPKTGGTFLLKKPVNGLNKKDKFIGSETYSDLQTPEGFTNKSQKEQISKLPDFQKNIINAENEQRRKDYVRDDMKKAYQNPLMYAPGIIAAAPLAVAGLSEAGMASAPYIQGALSTQLPGMANVSGATVGNAITAGFAGHGATHITPDAIEMYKNPSWSNAGNLAMDVAEISPLIGPTSKVIGKGLNTAGKYLTEETALKNAYKANPLAERLNNPNSSYRVAGMDAAKDFENTGILRSVTATPPEGASLLERAQYRPTSFPSFQKGYADMAYLPEEGGVVFETKLPTFKRGELNPVTGYPIKGRHYAHRVIDPKTGATMTEIPSENIRMFGDKPHWLKGYPEVTKQLPGSSNKINTKKMWRIENPNIKFNPSKVANENAQQEHVGNWFSDDINYVSDYLRKNQKVPGSRLAEVNVPESELSKYHISNYPDMKDVEPRNWLIPDAFNRNYTDLSHLPISGGNLSKIKENQNYIKELVNKKIAEKKYGGWLDTYEDGGETYPPVNLRSASTQLASPVSTQAPEVPLNKTGWDWVKQKYENRQPSEWNMLMMDKSGSYVDSGVDPFSLMLTAPQQVIKAGVKGGKALLDASKNNKIKSEIDWSKWNKEIPENTKLMKEYNTIEQTSKANGTWMKNPDGSKFEGTPEQFVQQNSSNFKKAFPGGASKTYRGITVHNHNLTDNYNSVFTADKAGASGYTRKGMENKYFNPNIPNIEEQISIGAKKYGMKEPVINKSYRADMMHSNEAGMHELYYTNKDKIIADFKNSDFNDIKKSDIPKELLKYLPNKKTYFTDDIAEALEKSNFSSLEIKNIIDPFYIERETIHNLNKSKLKSARGNNGMFDMTNPNIYKAAIPIGLGVAASQNKQDNSQWLNKYK